MSKIVDSVIKPLSKYPLQAYLDNRIQLFDIIEYILKEVGESEIFISTYSTSEEFLRRIYRFKEKGLIRKAKMLIDLKAAKKTVNLYYFISNVFDECYLAENHSKVILIKNDNHTISICTSQNQTRGNRTESGMISTDPIIYYDLYMRFEDIVKNKSMLLNDIF